MKRQIIDRIVGRLTFIPAFAASLLLIVMTGVLCIRSQEILLNQSLPTLLFSSVWQPMAGKFGFLPFIAGTVWVTFVAMALSIPISLFSAIYLSQYAHRRIKATVQPLIDLLAGIPSIVFGLFGVLLLVPLVKDLIAPAFHISTSGYCVLTGGLVLAIMVVPLITSIAFEVLTAVPEDMRIASLAMGANRWETVKYVVFRKAFPGIVAAVVLGFSRAFGETMAVLMVVGNVAKIPSSLFDPAYPIPALIANNYGEMMSIPLYDSALMFAALLLLVVVVIFNIIANIVLIRVKRGIS
ncbi:MAG: phosphate ABC transporter permease subunit PstC [Methanoregulaceae archaeon]|nr:phosphate ABC transporter permease subunit PstC [Methanoregulaceae archaeon]